jgi:HK97 family phage prohead protease
MSTKPEIEQRILCRDVQLEQRDGQPAKIRGYAAVFNQLSEDLGGFREQLTTGAFSDAIGNSDVRALINHDSNLVLGRNKSETLTMREDANGLYVEITPPDTQAARDLVELMKRGDVNQMSFAFTVSREDQTWTRDGTGPWIRTIKRVNRLYDVSVVTYPAYPQTSAAVRELQHLQDAASARALAEAEEERQRQARAREINWYSVAI